MEIRCDDTLIICDAGSGIRELGAHLLRKGDPVHAHLLFTHTHWDHIQGFPFFTPAYLPTSRFHIYDQEDSQGRFYSLLSGQMNSEYFPVQFSDLKATFVPEIIRHGQTNIGPIDVRTFEQHHPGGSLGYAFTVGETRVVYATDNEFDEVLVEPGREGDVGTTLRRAEPKLAKFLFGADLLIADAQFTDGEYPSRKGWGHASCFTATDLAIQAGVKRLALFHHDPTRSDAALDEMAAACMARAALFGSDLKVFPAREGIELRAPMAAAKVAEPAEV